MIFDLIAFIDISKHYSQKATIEHELPTATQKLITTNDCILSSVVALTSGAGKVIFL